MIPWFLALLLCIASLAFGIVIAAKSIGSKEEEVLRGAVEATAHAVAVAALEEVRSLANQHAIMHAVLVGVIREHGPQSCSKAYIESNDVPPLRTYGDGSSVTIVLA